MVPNVPTPCIEPNVYVSFVRIPKVVPHLRGHDPQDRPRVNPPPLLHPGIRTPLSARIVPVAETKALVDVVTAPTVSTVPNPNPLSLFDNVHVLDAEAFGLAREGVVHITARATFIVRILSAMQNWPYLRVSLASAPVLELRVFNRSKLCDHIEPLSPMEDTCKGVLKTQTYRLLDHSTTYDSQYVKETSSWQRNMTPLMRGDNFHGPDRIRVFAVLRQFRMASCLMGYTKKPLLMSSLLSLRIVARDVHRHVLSSHP